MEVRELPEGENSGIAQGQGRQPRFDRQIWNAFHAGDMAEARRIQLSVADINAAVTGKYGVPGLKYAMDRAGFCGGVTRRPLLPLSPEGRADIDRLLAQLGVPK